MNGLLRRFPALVSAIIAAVASLVGYEIVTAVRLSGFVALVLSYICGLVAGRLVGRDARRAALGALVPLAFVAPDVVADTELTQILILGIVALGLNILTGWAGQLNLAQGIFVGLGAYTTAILGTQHGWPLLATIPVAGVVCALIGLALGMLALRFAGVYLAVLTTSVALVVPVVLKHFSDLTGGAQGISVDAVHLPARLATSLGTNQFNYFLVLVIAVVAAALSWNILSRRTGRAFWALRDSPPAAAGIGVDVTRYKVVAFGLSSFWAGVAGALYAITVGFINPDSFGLFYGVQFLTMIVIGGLSTIAGSFIGAALIYELTTQVQTVGLPGSIGGQDLSLPQQSVFALILILVVIVAPRGIAGLLYGTAGWSRLGRRWFRRESGAAQPPGTGPVSGEPLTVPAGAARPVAVPPATSAPLASGTDRATPPARSAEQ